MSYSRNRTRETIPQNHQKHDSKQHYMNSIIEDEVMDISNREYPILYKKRWIMLFLISSLNIVSDWTCFSVAPIATLTSTSLPHVNPTLLIVIFLFSNGVSTYYEPSILGLLGLRRTILLGSILLMIGNLLKSGGIETVRIYVGFLLVGLSQPLYQCTPAILSSSWFPDKERTLATGVALNSNQLGIGCAFFFGTYFVRNADDLKAYFTILGIMSFVLCALVLILFENAPPSPPSDTARVLKGTLKWSYWRTDADDDASHITTTPNFASPLDFFLSSSTQNHDQSSLENSSVVSATFSQISNAYFPPIIENNVPSIPLHRRPGFLHSLIAFSISTVIINTVSASMDYLLNQTNVGITGSLFQLIIMASSLAFGRYTDHSRAYYSVLLLLLLCGAFAMAACGLNYNITPSLFLIAFFIGPILPISTELGIEISYPLCANAVLVLFQFVANISSALFLPIFDLLKRDKVDFQRSWELLILIHAIGTVYFSTFRGRYRRMEVEKFGEEEPLLKKEKHRII